MQATLLSILGLALLGALHAQNSIPVQADFQQDKVHGAGVCGMPIFPGMFSKGGTGGLGALLPWEQGEGAPVASSAQHWSPTKLGHGLCCWVLQGAPGRVWVAQLPQRGDGEGGTSMLAPAWACMWYWLLFVPESWPILCCEWTQMALLLCVALSSQQGWGGWGEQQYAVSHGSAGREGCSMVQPSCPALSRVCVQLAGRWYSIGLASNSNWFKDKKHLMKMCTTDITVTADGNMEVTSTYPKGDQCEKRNSLYIRTEQPGRFSYTSPRWGSNHDIRVVETNYDEYALVATQISKSTGSSNMVLLYSRTKELAPQRLERFMQFSQEQGLKDEEILILPQTDKCMADAA
uniref:Prostaglandin-H2 D-isomerase n=1 Tax=Meleagris gallopavo TaxID=9103 RepID=G1MQ26_MELGA